MPKNVTDKNFINWMRPQPYSSFRKLYGIYNNGLEKGKYKMLINLGIEEGKMGFPTSNSGKKYFILTSKNWMGKNSAVVGVLSSIASTFCLFSSIFFFFTSRYDKRLRFNYLKKSSFYNNSFWNVIKLKYKYMSVYKN